MINNQVLSIWKESGMTSYDVVKLVKKKNKNNKVGHCGTLDPFADGVMIICTGEKTKDIQDFMNLKKEYIANIRLGYETDTLDKTGTIINENKVPQINKNKIVNILKSFLGETSQIPPFFSALKFKGIPLYKYARKDIFIRKKPRLVYIENLKLLDFNQRSIKIHISCGKGTYIRSLARDVSYKLGTFGFVDELSRVALGSYNKENSISINDLQKA